MREGKEVGNSSSLVGNSPKENFGGYCPPRRKFQGFLAHLSIDVSCPGEALQPETPVGPGKAGTGYVGLSPWKGKSSELLLTQGY